MTGNHTEYWDDTGFTADGDFRNGLLCHGGEEHNHDDATTKR